MGRTLEESTVRHIAHLARLRISDAEVACYAEQLSKILDYVSQLNELNTSDVPPTTHAIALSNVFRDDVAGVPWSPEQALVNAPQRHDGFFALPKVLDQESA